MSTDGEQHQFTLYASDMCPYAQRSVITANELGVPFKLHPIQLGKDNKEAWYSKINPLGKVPAVTAGSETVVESLVIDEYLVEKFGSSSHLMPSDAFGRANVRILTQRSSDFVSAYMGLLRCTDLSERQQKTEAFTKELQSLEKCLAASETGWLLGSQDMTLADIAYFPFFERAVPCLKAFRGFDMSTADVPHILQWIEKCKSKASVSQTLKDPETWVSVYRKYIEG